MIVIDGAKALELLRNVIVGKEDFVYNPGNGSCRYTEGNADDEYRPSCVVGQALVLAGVPISVLREMDNCGDSAIYDEDVEEVLDRHQVQLIGKAMHVFDAAQSVQDRAGNTWGETLESAERKIG